MRIREPVRPVIIYRDRLAVSPDTSLFSMQPARYFVMKIIQDMDGQRCPGNSCADLAKYNINRYSVAYQNCSPESLYRR